MVGRPKKVHQPASLRPPWPEDMRSRRPPGDLSQLVLQPEQKEFLERQALDIFTLMVNSGQTFASSLAAILLTGLDWGANAHKERNV